MTTNEAFSSDTMAYFFEVYESLPRGGPGNDECTRRAFQAIPDIPEAPRILDIGCGPGMQSKALARMSGGHVTAVDLHVPFIERLKCQVEEEGLSGQLTPMVGDMTALPFEKGSFDVVWSEGAIYFLGLERGLQTCHDLVKPGGGIAITEAALFRPDPIPEVWEMWEVEYPDIRQVEGILDVARNVGLEILTHFSLPREAWLDTFYDPMDRRVDELYPLHEAAGDLDALKVLDSCRHEADTYRKYSDWYGYEFVVMRRPLE